MDLLRRPALLHARATREFFTEAERVPPASFPVRLVSLAHPLQRCRPLHRSARDLIRRVTERGGTGYERRISDGLRLIARLPRLPRVTSFPTAIPPPLRASPRSYCFVFSNSRIVRGVREENSTMVRSTRAGKKLVCRLKAWKRKEREKGRAGEIEKEFWRVERRRE